MDVDLLSLKWNNHKSTFLHIIGNLRSKASYTDATLACNGKFYPVHRLVLSTCSEYFSDIFEHTGICKNPIIVLKDVECKNLEYLLDYMYIGEVNVKQNELASLVGAAEYLRIKGLAVPDEDPVPRHNSSNKRLSSDYQKSSSPPMKRKRSLQNVSESEVNFSDKGQAASSLGSVNSNFEERSVFDDSSLNIKSEPQSDDDILENNFVPDSIVRPKQDNISDANPSLESELDGNSELIGKQEPVDLSDDDLNEAEETGIYDNDPFPPDTEASCSQPQEDAMFKLDCSSSNQIISENEFGIPTDEINTLSDIILVIFTTDGIRFYKCRACSYVTKLRPNAQRHAMTHTGEKPFSCSLCHYRTSQKANLKKHYTIHTGEKPFGCSLCHYKTVQKSFLKNHYKIHSVDKH